MERQEFIDDIMQQMAAANVTKRDGVLLISELLQALMSDAPLPHTQSSKPQPIPMEKPTETIPFTPKSIKYDGMYDPPPPFGVEPVPERVETVSRILTPKNTACVCAACRKVVYITNKDVVDGMKVADFIGAYTPTDGMSPINKTAEIENLDGNIATDCPACGAMKKLYLTGGPRA